MKKGVKITTKDNIVFDAENTLQDVFGINDFTPVKLHVDYERYNKFTKDGEDYLKNFNDALSWVYDNHVKTDTLSVREFSLDMMLEFE